LSVEELSLHQCWELLRAHEVARLAVWVDDHPDIFPINYVVDRGTVIFRSAAGTKVSAALSDTPVALEVDGFDQESNRVWSVVLKGQAESVEKIDEVLDTFDLELTPWHEGPKNWFVRIVPTSVTGRRFPKTDSKVWQTPSA